MLASFLLLFSDQRTVIFQLSGFYPKLGWPQVQGDSLSSYQVPGAFAVSTLRVTGHLPYLICQVGPGPTDLQGAAAGPALTLHDKYYLRFCCY